MHRLPLAALLGALFLTLVSTSAFAEELAPDIRPATPKEQAAMEELSREDQPSVSYTYSNARVSPSRRLGAIDTAGPFASYVEVFEVFPGELDLLGSIPTPVTCDGSRAKDVWDVDIESLGIVPPDHCSLGLSPYLATIRIKTFKRKIKSYNRGATKANRYTKRVCRRKRSTKAKYRCARSAYNRYVREAGYVISETVEDAAATVSWAFCQKALLGYYTNNEAAMDARIEMYDLLIKGDWIGAAIAEDDEARASRKAKRNKATILTWCPAP